MNYSRLVHGEIHLQKLGDLAKKRVREAIINQSKYEQIGIVMNKIAGCEDLIRSVAPATRAINYIKPYSAGTSAIG
jgi:hypothetical protein